MLQDELANEEKLLVEARAAWGEGSPPPLPEEKANAQKYADRIARLRQAVQLPTGRAIVGGLLVAVSGLGIFAAHRAATVPDSTNWLIVRRPVAAGATISVDDLALAPMTWLRNDDWRSDLALWESETAAAPQNPDAWKWLTAAYMNANRWDDVVRICDERERQGVRHAPLLVHCSFAYDNRGRPADAERASRGGDDPGRERA